VHTSTTQLADIAEITPVDPADIAALRYGAMMTSKWLSFGRVLFSPAHNELQLAEEPRVLVVDGLGSDWSYYVALTYKMASVYNLCPDSLGSPASSWPDPEQKAPRNHFQIPFSGIASPIPFPKGYFNAVVFRFPATASEDAYKFFVSECKRVLRPGGFLEVAVLDLDLVNMGNNMRKAVRDLKTRIQRRDQNLCLQNLSDVLVRLIGRRGFDDVQRCIVGVPAVGRIPRSQDVSSISSDDAGGAARTTRHRENSAEGNEDLKFSFADLLDESATLQFVPGNGSNDESITKMVAKVGRWWYSTCYEQVNHNIEHAIWSDRSLLKECEKNGTSFRLLICHAQKPAQTRRRTVSV
jgi:SAM-dependent methyltransferase